jgi:hypothetical protein
MGPLRPFIAAIALCAAFCGTALAQTRNPPPRTIWFEADVLARNALGERPSVTRTIIFASPATGIYAGGAIADGCEDLPRDFPESSKSAHALYRLEKPLTIEFKCLRHGRQAPVTVKMTSTATWSDGILKLSARADYESGRPSMGRGTVDETTEIEIKGRSCVVMNYRRAERSVEVFSRIEQATESVEVARPRTPCKFE